MPHTQLKFAAFALAYKAKVNEVDPLDVDHLLTEVDTQLPHDHMIFRGVTHFVTQYELVAQDPEAVKRLGDELARLVESWAVPEPPDLNRTDIHG
ncbi:hypothetical protein [Roseobacter sp.]|uniref:hypothetical protein n=1 Tax=Roseobacter sp. TaxID=1907202 RepID=UPI00296702E5|nr:hypothetical protein [Roseobacter sp.]MDW3181749.1 hypothetical protein [Roseobacter sp.]